MRTSGSLTVSRAAAALSLLLSATSCLPGGQRAVAVAAAAPASAAAGAAPRPVATARAELPAAPPEMLLATPPPLAAVGAGDPVPATGAAPAFLAANASPDDAARALDCLTAAVYYEARSEPVDGQRAVAQVVLNRVRNPAFPASVCGVVYQGSTRRTGCQFTFTCDGSTLFRREPDAWERARQVAAAALAGSVYAPVGAATYYHTTAVSPWWAPSLNRVAQIGAHIFYRLGNAWSSALDFRQSYAGLESGPGVAADTGQTPDARVADVLRFVMAGGTVSVHHGDAGTIAGVTVHHGMPGDPAAAAVTRTAAADPPPAAAVAATSAAGDGQAGDGQAGDGAASVSGVRVHRGTASADTAAQPPAPAAG